MIAYILSYVYTHSHSIINDIPSYIPSSIDPEPCEHLITTHGITYEIFN